MKTSHNPSQADDAATDPQGETVPVMSEGRAPRLPHERDESSSSQQGAQRDVIRQAGKDVKKGLKDTSLGTPMDDTYAREFRSEEDSSGAADAQPSDKGGPMAGPRVHRP